MKKEVVFAIVIGFTIGLIITFGVYTAQKALKEKGAAASPSPTPQLEASPAPSHTLSISSPEDEDLVSTDHVDVTGTTTPNSIITIVAEKDQLITYADAAGKFSASVPLIGGANQITLTALSDTGAKASQELTLVYSTATIEP